MTADQVRIELTMHPDGALAHNHVAWYKHEFPEFTSIPHYVVVGILLRSMEGHCACGEPGCS